MLTANVRSISIDLWRRAASKDYAVTIVVRPRTGGAATRKTHILDEKLAQLIALLDIPTPEPSEPPATPKKN